MHSSPESSRAQRSLLVFVVFVLSTAFTASTVLGCTCSSPPPSCVVDAENRVSVTACGAVGDASTDDCPAIQCAIDAIPSAGGTVFFPPGRYLTDDTLTIHSGVTLEGIGQGAIGQAPLAKSTVLAGTGLSGNPMVQTTAGTGNTRIKIAGLNFDGNGETLPWVLDLVNFFGSRIEEVRVGNVNGGGIRIYAESGQVAWTNWIEDSVIGVDDIGLLMGGSDSFVRGLYVSGGKGIVDENSGGNVYVNCHVDRSTTSGLTFRNPANQQFNVSVINSYFDLNSDYGIAFTFSSPPLESHVTVVGNVFRANTTGDVYLGNAHNVSIVGNTFNTAEPTNAAGTNIFWLGNVDYISVLGNQVKAGIKPFGKRSTVAGNGGYINRANGTSTIGGGASSLVVSHGMNVVPNQVILQPASNLGSLEHWVDQLTATTFRIRLSGAAPSNLTFHWMALTTDAL